MRKEIIGNATLYCGDCLKILPTLEKVDAVVTDPPYGVKHPCNFRARKRCARAKCNDYPDVHGDDMPFDPSWILNMNVPTCLWGANYFANKLPTTSGWLVWDKERPDNLDQATCELAWTNFVKGVRRFKYLWNGVAKDGEHGESYHPTQKPVALMKWIFSLRWAPSGTVLDPFMGSGTTGVAAVQLGRKFIGIEIEPRYFDIACERIEAAQRQTDLFQSEQAQELPAPADSSQPRGKREATPAHLGRTLQVTAGVEKKD